MTNTVATRQPAFSIEPISYPVIAEKIGELSAEYMPLRVNGLDDSKGLKIVHDARMVVKNLRVQVDKRRKELKAASLEYGRQVDTAAKQLTDLLEPIESHLQAEEDTVENEKARIKAEAEEAKRQKLQKRLEALMDFGVVGNAVAVEAMTDDGFQGLLDRAEAEHDAKLAAEREAAEKQKQEAARLAAERAELDRQRKEQEAERAKLEAERRAIELENARREAAECARIETEQRIAREQEQARLAAERKAAQEKADAEAKEAARLKAEGERPQRYKLDSVADLVEMVPVPSGPGSKAVKDALLQCSAQIRKIANGPLA